MSFLCLQKSHHHVVQFFIWWEETDYRLTDDSVISRPDVWIDSCFTLHVSPRLPLLSFFTLPQDECNLCLWADMQNISFSFNGLINTSVHKVLTTFCSLNISVNPVFCFEFGWLSQHVLLVVSQCSPSCHQWGTWSVWISFDFPKI